MTSKHNKKITKNWGAIYIELAKDIREKLGEDAHLITWKPREQIDFENVSGCLFDEFKSILHYKLSMRTSSQPYSPADERKLIANTLTKHELFLDNLFVKSKEISLTIDNLIERNLY